MTTIPDYYDPNRIGQLFYPDVQKISEQAEAAGLKAAAEDDTKVLFLIIDMQVDFCHEQGTLYTPGALDDIRRVTDFTFRNAESITHITCSMDSHYPFQIFHPPWWVDESGGHPPPFTVITYEDVKKGVWRPACEPEWSMHYVEELERQAKKQLLIWPYHVPIGGVGHMIDPELWSAVFWHSVARRTQPTWWRKGSLPKTEHYSVLQPEVNVAEDPQGGLSPDFLHLLDEYDYVLIAGEAASHCVQETAEDLIDVYGDTPEKLQRFLLLKDCTSPVQHPEIDFARIAEEKFASFEKAGLRLIDSTAPLPF